MADMELIAALEVLSEWRSEELVVATMGASREWRRLSDHRFDFHFIPSTMSGGLPLGLGLALARPDKQVIVLSGDGSLLMSLGSLLTASAAGCPNLTLLLIDNGVYEVTGGQHLVGDGEQVDWVSLATAARFPSVSRFDDLATWKSEARHALTQPGPRFIDLVVAPMSGDTSAVVPGPMAPRIKALREALAAAPTGSI